MCVTGDFILFSPSRLRIRILFAEGPRTSLSTVGCCRRMHPTEVWLLSISCLSYATSLVDGVVNTKYMYSRHLYGFRVSPHTSGLGVHVCNCPPLPRARARGRLPPRTLVLALRPPTAREKMKAPKGADAVFRHEVDGTC